jgi:hypothetical protein
MRWLRWILGCVLVVVLLLVGLKLAMYSQSFRRGIFTFIAAGETSLHLPAPWYVEADPFLAKKIKDETGYDVLKVFQCDVPTCGYRGRFVAINFPAEPDGKVNFDTRVAGRLGELLAEPDSRLPSQADYTANAMTGITSSEGGNYIALQLDQGDDEDANAMLNAAIDRWRKAVQK